VLRFLRDGAGPGSLFVLGAGWQIAGWHNEGIGIALLVIGAVWGATALPLPFLTSRLPKFRFHRYWRGFTFSVDWPIVRKKKRLKADTATLADDVFRYLREQPLINPPFEQMRAAETEQERQEAWDRSTAQMIEQSEQQRQQLQEHFGGRFVYLIDAYIRLGLLPEHERDLLMWEGQSVAHIGRAVSRLQGLSHQL
jgi:hypothetical protein